MNKPILRLLNDRELLKSVNISYVNISCLPSNYRYYIIFLVLFFFPNITEINAQELRKRIEVNHKVYSPEGNGPFPVVLAIPGCSGVSLNGPETDTGRPGDQRDWLFRRHYSKMAERLKEEGFMVLLLDYLTAEGVLNTCGWEIHPKRVGEYIKEAISFVKTIQIADTTRINVIGWSHGGEGVLQWLTSLEEETNGIQSAIAVYPGCSASNAWETSLPVLVLLGEADAIALPGICDSLIQSLPKQTNVHLISFPNARHGFDLTEGPNILSVGNGLTVGRNLEAGNQAWQEILQFLNDN